jgi:predicted DNA-binding transcriptional regulator YafY
VAAIKGNGTKLKRVMELFYVLAQHPSGISAEDIASKLGVDKRYVYRDRLDLEALIGPIISQNGKWKITPDGFLPPVRFSLLEAMTIFIAARLLLSYSNAYNPSIASAFKKVSFVAPAPLRDYIRHTMEWMQKQKIDSRFCNNLEMLSRAWIEQRKAKIEYLTLGQKESKSRIIEPYFIQPASSEHGNYVIGYCHLARKVRTFKIERVKSVQLLDENYAIPEDFNANEYLGTAFGISVYGKPEIIKLKFNPVIGTIARETNWHHSQETQMQPDGSAIVTFNVPLTEQLESFILGWGEKAEVLEPEKLRKRINKIVRDIAKLYN